MSEIDLMLDAEARAERAGHALGGWEWEGENFEDENTGRRGTIDVGATAKCVREGCDLHAGINLKARSEDRILFGDSSLDDEQPQPLRRCRAGGGVCHSCGDVFELAVDLKQHGCEPRERPIVKLTGEDGNVFNVMGRVQRALRDAGQHEKAKEFVDRAMASRSYDAVLALAFDYCEVR